jgi:hypothetical protein
MKPSPIQPCHDGLRSGRLRTLGDIMEDFPASLFFNICRICAEWKVRHAESDVPLGDTFRVGQSEIVKKYDARLRAMGLSASAATFSKMGVLFDKAGCTWKETAKLSEEALGRLIDEVNGKQFFVLTPRESDVFSNPRRGWELSLERFPAIIDDVEEASKSFALSRYAASVFHSVQLVEHGLIELGTFLKVTDPHSGWTAVAGALQKVVNKKHQDRTSFEKKNFQFLEQMQGSVQGLKNAWRNKISHAHGRLVLMSKEFSPEIAEEILMATRAFMRRLAEELPPPKPKKASKK